MRSGFPQLEFLCVGFSSTWSWHILNITWCISIRRTWCIQSDVLAGDRNVRYDWSSCGDFFAGANCEIACRTPYEGRVLLVAICLNSQVILLGNWIDRTFYGNCLGHFFLGRGPKHYKLHDPLWDSVLARPKKLLFIDWICSRFVNAQFYLLILEFLKLLSWRKSPVSFLSDFFELKGCTFPVIVPMSSLHVKPSLFEVDDRRITWFSASRTDDFTTQSRGYFCSPFACNFWFLVPTVFSVLSIFNVISCHVCYCGLVPTGHHQNPC